MEKSKINYLLFFLFLFLNGQVFLYGQSESAPNIFAEGRQALCLGSPVNIVTDFSITDDDDTTIPIFFIQISNGYQINIDRLELLGSHPNISTSWDEIEGKLTLISAIPNGEMLLSDLENAVKDIVLTTGVDNIVSEKSFSFTIDETNYLPSTGNFYEFVDRPNITWTAARAEAETRTYYGRPGYLATLTSQEEADFAGKQANGTGWIGGSDEEVEGEWKWVTGPEAGTVFWRGQVSGTTTNYANWNRNEPNDFRGNNTTGEDYAHITDPNIPNVIIGSWNDLPNTGGSGLYQAKGYVVEYGTPNDPPLNIVGSTSVYIPQILSTQNAVVCESGTATIFATPSEGEIFWYESSQRGIQPELARGNSFTLNNITETKVYYASISLNGCITLDKIPVTVTVNERPTIVNTTNDLICSGTAVLSAEASEGSVYWYEDEISTTPIFIGDNFQTPELTETTSYFVEANNSNCETISRTEVTVVVDNTIPQFQLSQENKVLCKDIGNLDLEIINPQGDYTYVWKKDGELLLGDSSTINVNSTGNYTVYAISEAGCSSLEQEITIVDSEKASITKDDIIITEDSANNSIQIANPNLGTGEYEFAIDNITGPYTTDSFFPNLSTGLHTLYIKDIGGCGITEYQFSILLHPKFFTPNGDSENDIWKIEGYDKSFYTVSNIYIYNRFGNLIYTIDENSEGWDGTYQGKLLPENTYWFRTFLTDINGYSVEKMGSFSLIRK